MERLRLFYFKTVYGEKIMRQITICDTVENIKKNYDIYYLTDICGNAIIDNRKRGN